MALVQLQPYVHPSWICLFPPAWEQPTRISACGYPSPQLCHALQPPILLPFPSQTAWTPHSFPMTASPPSDSASFETTGRAMLRGAKSFSLPQAELLSSPRCSSHLLCRALTSASCISPKSCCHSSLPDFCGEQLCAPCAGAPHVTKRVLWALPCLLPLQTALVRFFLQLLIVSRPHPCCLETGNIFCLRF